MPDQDRPDLDTITARLSMLAMQLGQAAHSSPDLAAARRVVQVGRGDIPEVAAQYAAFMRRPVVEQFQEQARLVAQRIIEADPQMVEEIMALVADLGDSAMQQVEQILPVEWTDRHLLVDGDFTAEQRTEAHSYLAARLVQEAYERDPEGWPNVDRQDVAAINAYANVNGEVALGLAPHIFPPEYQADPNHLAARIQTLAMQLGQAAHNSPHLAASRVALQLGLEEIPAVTQLYEDLITGSLLQQFRDRSLDAAHRIIDTLNRPGICRGSFV